ncbi:hypothetical protein POSPLADRAFT_1135259 [Postia placenta MAD-698-R-SB12]|uniref:25S rRNA adenine-N(1) methyltransferase n=1 Tax=Postia placenta MAD-698-R-SB12 TaxID=670580 RepID=A0A1X6N8H9_9APHY|nr:hypothetical protein POSPLADRAFT_1135259 [Postia placenta MAD-698-R-SB12]OSX64938.1 hypothetical protein POSPLADRAFT_1135259 [Postia placenta MAD-698-R-SB12]
MPKARKNTRKAPITHGEVAAPAGSSSNPAATRAVIRRFHVLLKRKAQLEKAPGDARTAQALADVKHEIESLGGLKAYQRMSTIGQGNDRGGGSEKIFVGWLQDIGVAGSAQAEEKRLRLLEVGALKPDNYASCSAWIEATPIDLRSNHPAIKEQDFLLMDEEENCAQWDLISLSLVLNFVPDAPNRGRMLRMAHSMLRPGGYVFLALPLPCIMNSRYLTSDHLEALLQTVGLSVVKTRWKEGGKMAYWLLSKSQPDDATAIKTYSKKVVLRSGKRNNFAILL